MARIAVVLAEKIKGESNKDAKTRLRAVAEAHGATIIPGTEIKHDGIVTFPENGMTVEMLLNYGACWAAFARFPEDAL